MINIGGTFCAAAFSIGRGDCDDCHMCACSAVGVCDDGAYNKGIGSDGYSTMAELRMTVNVCVIFCLLFPQAILSVYTSEAALVMESVPAMAICMAFLFVCYGLFGVVCVLS